jgi:hypothetical protein
MNWTKVLRDRNVVYGVHPSSNGRIHFRPADARALQTSLRAATRHVPVIFDQVAREQTQVDIRRSTTSTGAMRVNRTTRVSTDTMHWSSGLLDWVTGWTVLEGGDGAIIAGLGTSTRDNLSASPRRLTPWGRTVASGYLAMGFRAAKGKNPGAGFSGGANLGDRGPIVRVVQRQLVRLGYLPPGGVNGIYGQATWHAVVAFQGYSGLTRDGSVEASTLVRLMRAPRPTARHPKGGKHIEVDISRQIVMLVNASGAVRRVIHTSTGLTDNTPTGWFTIHRKERSSWVPKLEISLPYANYFHEGFALHEFDEVPLFPASRGCPRLPRGEAKILWDFAAMGTPIVLYR